MRPLEESVKDNKKEKAQAIADIIQQLLQQVDLFTQVLSKEDFEILDETRDALKNKITYKKSAMPLLIAIGADADTTDDEMKLKTIDKLIELIKVRIEYREEIIKIQQSNKNKQDAVNLFRSMGIL